MHEAAPRRQRNAAAVQRDVGEADAGRAFALKHRRAAVKDQSGRAAHADQLRAVLQAQHSGAIDARRQRQRHLRPRGLVDRALQSSGLIVGAAGPDAILRGVAPERRGQRCGARGIGRHRQRAGRAGHGCSDEMAAIEVHGRVSGGRAWRVRMSGSNAKMRRGMVRRGRDRAIVGGRVNRARLDRWQP